MLLHQKFGLEIINLETQAADIVAVQEVNVLIRLPVTGVIQDGFDSLPRFRVLLGRFWSLPG